MYNECHFIKLRLFRQRYVVRGGERRGRFCPITAYGTFLSERLAPRIYETSIKFTYGCPSRFSSVGRASDSLIFREHEFESWQPHLCNSTWGQHWQQASYQEVGMCSTRGGSQGMCITFASAMQIRQNPLWL